MTDSASTPLTASGSLLRPPAAKSLFSKHYLQARLSEHPEWAADPEWRTPCPRGYGARLSEHPEWAADPRPAFETVAVLWERARTLGGMWNEAQTEQEFIKSVLDALGWSYIAQVKAQHRGGRKRAARKLASGAGERGV